MLFFYSLIYTLGFLLMLPVFIFNRSKYLAGFNERLGKYPQFIHDGRKVIWLHCVSVGEANAARPLVDEIKRSFPGYGLIVSTTTKTGQELAKNIFAGKADAVFYFPFDWKSTVRRALDNFKPSAVLLMETEIWPRFIHEASRTGAKVAIVNGRLSERSFNRYSNFAALMKKVLANISLALMQGEADAKRITSLGMDAGRTNVTGNIKFDLELNESDAAVTSELDERFGFSDGKPLIIAASTHEPEERWVLDAFCSVLAGDARNRSRLLIAPRHPERFDAVAKLIRDFRNDPACEWTRYSFARRSAEPSPEDSDADIILLDSIGELRGAYPLAQVVFVGGSLIPHGGQSVLEPAAAGKAIATGPYTHNFTDVVKTFLEKKALIQFEKIPETAIPDDLFLAFSDLLEDNEEREELARNAANVMAENRGATRKTVELLRMVLS
ncbi:MAG: 3-deoxy-D-manno-octulosonic acid transferase [Acidobacteria bacterium]|nr:3-deoxy-D-manno-octulosonic acid transferase [Acidobacteriota bacterium]